MRISKWDMPFLNYFILNVFVKKDYVRLSDYNLNITHRTIVFLLHNIEIF